MKRLLCTVVVFICLWGVEGFTVRASALEFRPDILDYPEAINNGTILLNGGIGFAGWSLTNGDMQCPPLMVSADAALPISTLPLSTGLIMAFSTETGAADFSSTNLGFAFRLAWHPNLNLLRRLDTYLLLNLGYIIEWTTRPATEGDFWIGIVIGGRYFFLPHFGAYLEAGVDRLYNISFGAAFRL